MTNAELIAALRTCADHNAVGDKCYGECPYNGNYNECVDQMILDAANALEADDKRIADLEDDLMCGTVSEPERFGINGYSMKDLLLFADMCKRNDVQESDMKQAAWNLELAIRAVVNERQEIVKNTMDKISVRFTPDIEKAFAEMRGEHE